MVVGGKLTELTTRRYKTIPPGSRNRNPPHNTIPQNVMLVSWVQEVGQRDPAISNGVKRVASGASTHCRPILLLATLIDRFLNLET
jgi:hypothetical protein